MQTGRYTYGYVYYLKWYRFVQFFKIPVLDIQQKTTVSLGSESLMSGLKETIDDVIITTVTLGGPHVITKCLTGRRHRDNS